MLLAMTMLPTMMITLMVTMTSVMVMVSVLVIVPASHNLRICNRSSNSRRVGVILIVVKFTTYGLGCRVVYSLMLPSQALSAASLAGSVRE